VRHNTLVILISVLLIGQVSPIFAEFNIDNNEPIANPDYVNSDKLKGILPESVQNLINGAENVGSNVIQQGADIVTGKKSMDINPIWWQKVKDSIASVWEKINSVADIKGFLIKVKDVVVSLLKTIWGFFSGMFTQRIISQLRA
jgi:uncharacterized protein YpuA (DUF1002 family)